MATCLRQGRQDHVKDALFGLPLADERQARQQRLAVVLDKRCECGRADIYRGLMSSDAPQLARSQ
jgi:hypothetical protein